MRRKISMVGRSSCVSFPMGLYAQEDLDGGAIFLRHRRGAAGG